MVRLLLLKWGTILSLQVSGYVYMNYVMLHDTVQFYDDRHQQSGTTQHSWELLDGAQQRAHTSGAIQ